MRNTVTVAIDRDVAGEGIRLREEKTLKCHEEANTDSKSSNHLGDIKPQRRTKSTKIRSAFRNFELLWLRSN
jgi:hypothetical protein